MRLYAAILIGIVLLAAGATFARYGNFDPCDWTAQDQAEFTSIPKMVWIGRLKAEFLVDGITQPAFSDCVLAWWQSRAEDAAEGSSN